MRWPKRPKIILQIVNNLTEGLDQQAWPTIDAQWVHGHNGTSLECQGSYPTPCEWSAGNGQAA